MSAGDNMLLSKEQIEKLGQIRKHSNNAAQQKSSFKESLIDKQSNVYQHLMTDQGGVDDTASNENTANQEAINRLFSGQRS